jgi:outer membrane biosynthesis protein TonB
VWPTVREGKTEGLISVYVSVDRSGHVREVWPLVSNNLELNQAAREQLLRWQYKPYNNGGPSQMEAVLTFAFSTRIENPIPILSDAEARKLAIRVVEAVVPPGKARKGAKFALRISVDEAGRVQSVQNQNKVVPALYTAGVAALKQWRFRPYMNNGKPDRFYADITFQVR